MFSMKIFFPNYSIYNLKEDYPLLRVYNKRLYCNIVKLTYLCWKAPGMGKPVVIVIILISVLCVSHGLSVCWGPETILVICQERV